MKKILGVLLVFGPLLLATPSYAKFGIIKTQVSFERKSPPEIYLPSGSAVEIRVSSIPQSLSPMIERQLDLLLQRELELAGVRVQTPNPSLVLDCLISSFQLHVKRETRTEEREIKVGEEKYKDEKGNLRVKDIYERREVPVPYRTINGHMTVDLRVKDGPSSQLCTSASFSSSFEESKEVSEDHWERGYPRKSEEVSIDLTRKIIEQMRPKFSGRADSVDVLLAVDDELKPGNALAKRSRWQDARDFWQTVRINHPKKEAARQYNIGASYEALAYQANDFSVAMKNFEQAESLYERARQMDPDEKYFREGTKRVRESKEHWERVRNWQEVQAKGGACVPQP